MRYLLFGSVVIGALALGSGRAMAADGVVPACPKDEAQKIDSESELSGLMKQINAGKVAAGTGSLNNYEVNGSYVLCFTSTDYNSGANYTFTNQLTKPLVIKNLATNLPVIIGGAQPVTLYNATLTNKNTALTISGAHHQVQNSTIAAANGVTGVDATQASQLTLNNLTITQFATGVKLAGNSDTLQAVQITASSAPQSVGLDAAGFANLSINDLTVSQANTGVRLAGMMPLLSGVTVTGGGVAGSIGVDAAQSSYLMMTGSTVTNVATGVRLGGTSNVLRGVTLDGKKIAESFGVDAALASKTQIANVLLANFWNGMNLGNGNNVVSETTVRWELEENIVAQAQTIYNQLNNVEQTIATIVPGYQSSTHVADTAITLAGNANQVRKITIRGYHDGVKSAGSGLQISQSTISAVPYYMFTDQHVADFLDKQFSEFLSTFPQGTGLASVGDNAQIGELPPANAPAPVTGSDVIADPVVAASHDPYASAARDPYSAAKTPAVSNGNTIAGFTTGVALQGKALMAKNNQFQSAHTAVMASGVVEQVQLGNNQFTNVDLPYAFPANLLAKTALVNPAKQCVATATQAHAQIYSVCGATADDASGNHFDANYLAAHLPQEVCASGAVGTTYEMLYRKHTDSFVHESVDTLSLPCHLTTTGAHFYAHNADGTSEEFNPGDCRLECGVYGDFTGQFNANSAATQLIPLAKELMLVRFDDKGATLLTEGFANLLGMRAIHPTPCATCNMELPITPVTGVDNNSGALTGSVGGSSSGGGSAPSGADVASTGGDTPALTGEVGDTADVLGMNNIDTNNVLASNGEVALVQGGVEVGDNGALTSSNNNGGDQANTLPTDHSVPQDSTISENDHDTISSGTHGSAAFAGDASGGVSGGPTPGVAGCSLMME